MAFWAGLALAVAFAVLPWLLHGYTYPPGDDPVVLGSKLGWGRHVYYGQWPANVLGMALYYYLTPVLIYLGCWVLLEKYGQWTPVLAWVSLWLLCRTLLFDLHSGTFVGLVNFYLVGFVLLRLMAEQRWGWAALLAALAVPFHAATGLLLAFGVGTYAVISRRWQVGLIAGALALTAALSWWLLASSIRHVSTFTQGVDNSGVTLANLAAEYIGPGLIVYWFLAFNAGMYAWQHKWRPAFDPALGILGIMSGWLALMSVPGIAVDADRTLKMLIGIITVLATVWLVQSLKHLARPVLNWASAAVVGGAFVMAAPQNLAYWLLSGSYR